MVRALRFPSSVSPSTKWSIASGIYLFLGATAVAYLLSDLLTLLGEVIGLPPGLALAVMASPALLIGAAAWWVVVERRAAYAYRYGGLVGLLTALLTGLVWVARFVDVWGVEMATVDIVSFLVAFVLGVAAVAGALVGLPLMYARRRLDGSPSASGR